MSQAAHNHAPAPAQGERLMPKGQCPACDAVYRTLTNFELKRRVRAVLHDGYPTRAIKSVEDYDQRIEPLVDQIINAMREVMWPPGGVHTVGFLSDPRMV